MTTWCRYIKNDLRTRITAGYPLPENLTLQGLASHYQVSLTPVRVALSELIEERYLRRLDNGRLAVNPRKAAGDSAERGLDRLPEPPRDIFGQIKNDLVELGLRGEAVFVREEETALRYGVSGTAVRQAFSRLAGMGILDHLPRRGWRLRPFDQKNLTEYSQVRRLLELEALRLAWSHLEDEHLAVMLQSNVLPRDETEEPLIDDGLHDYLVERAGNRYIRDFFERHKHYFTAVFTWEAMDRQAAIDTVIQHRAILEALLRRDREAARQALTDHLNYGHEVIKNKVCARAEAMVDS